MATLFPSRSRRNSNPEKVDITNLSRKPSLESVVHPAGRRFNMRQTRSAGGISVTSLTHARMSITSADTMSTTSSGDFLNRAMTDEQKKLVRETWRLALTKEKAKNATPISTFFEPIYTRMFERIPETKLMFGNTIRQGITLSMAISRMVKNLDDMPKFCEQMTELAGVHLAIGVTEDMFIVLGECILEGLELRLGDDWTADAHEAWSSMYNWASDLIQGSMYDMRLQPKKLVGWITNTLGPRKAQLIDTWNTIAPHPQEFVSKFYAAFFERCPEAKPLFHKKLDAQYKALAGTICQLIKVIDRPEKLDHQVRQLARIHSGMGITRHMCNQFCRALVVTLKIYLSPDFNNEDEAVWQKVMGLVATAMSTVIESAEAKGNIECTIS